ncbi:MAG: PDZ domain-containing protein [Deltaproteobacteria bacterium]|jgi:hypothetical protein|nr:PDZ domain-containing protein [Deltaproteobacteria bacterium]
MKARSFISIVVGIATILISTSGMCDLTRSQKISDAETLISLFKHRYAPILWKKDYLGISVDDLAGELLGEAYRTGGTDEDFYAAMARMAGGMKDTHIWFIIPSHYMTHLGFYCDYVEGRALIDYISRSSNPENNFPFKRGDELISIDGIPVEEILEDLAQYDSHGSQLAEKRFLTQALTIRPQRKFAHVPTGESVLEIFSQDRGKSETVTIHWFEQNDPLPNTADPEARVSKYNIGSSADIELQSDDALEDLKNLRWSALLEEKAIEAGIGNRTPFFPLWKSFKKITEQPLLSGTFKLDGRTIGFIRIPTWHPPSSAPWYKFFEEQIPYFQKNTDAIVIDQTNNGGGNLCLANDIAGYFVSAPIPNLLFHIRANNKRLVMYEGYANECKRYGKNQPKYCPIITRIANSIRKAITEGDALTEPLPLCVDDGLIHPAKDKNGKQIVYTKPVLLLANEWSISAADMFPATLQDADRIEVFGEQTCGAGGSVITSDYMGFTDFRVSQTETLAVRSREVVTTDGVRTRYLENAGVIPDIHYSITVDDFMNGYEEYRNAVDAALRTIVR